MKYSVIHRGRNFKDETIFVSTKSIRALSEAMKFYSSLKKRLKRGEKATINPIK